MWFRRKRADRPGGLSHLDAELRYHFDSLVRDSIAAGIPPAEARRRAQLEFGGIEQIKGFLAACARAPVPKLLHLEESFEISLGGTTLAGRIDRIDDLENGRVAASGPAVELAARDDVSGGARLVLAAGMHQLRQRSPCDKKHQRLQPRGRLSKSQGFKSPLRNRERNLIMSVGSHVESWKRIAQDAFAHLNRLLAERGNSDEDLVFQIRRSQEN